MAAPHNTLAQKVIPAPGASRYCHHWLLGIFWASEDSARDMKSVQPTRLCSVFVSFM